MFAIRVSKLVFDVASTEVRFRPQYSCTVIQNVHRSFVTSCQRHRFVPKSDVTPVSNGQLGNVWKSFLRKWYWYVPIGAGLSLYGIFQWKYLRKETNKTKRFIDGVMYDCYSCMPLRMTSRLWGSLASVEIPVFMRSLLYSCYANVFHADLNEVENDLRSFPSLADFFVRSLKPGSRAIADNTNIVSPADGKVLHFGPVNTCSVEQVKGVNYNLQHFLGENNIQLQIPEHEGDHLCDSYVRSLLKNSSNQLYQITVYLAPGDYHRFHSPTDWTVKLRRHFQGKLLSVNPKIVSWLPDLFSLNERVVYIGEWVGGFMAYAAIGATNVGSIRVYNDENLVTNTEQWPKAKQCEDADMGKLRLKKGEEFGEFRMGSTIVMLFEAPKDFVFSTQIGQRVEVGQALSNTFVNPPWDFAKYCAMSIPYLFYTALVLYIRSKGD